VPGNSRGVPPLVVLTGAGFVAVPGFTFTPTSIAFGTVQLDNSSTAKQVKIISNGTGPLVISSLTIAGANPGDFSLSADGCTGHTLNPSASCTAFVTFAPTRINARSATVAIATNGGSATVTLSGMGAVASGGGGHWTP